MQTVEPVVAKKASRGPFQARIQPGSIKIISADGEVIGRVYEWQENAVENAILMAASYELRAALEVAKVAIETWHGASRLEQYQQSPEMQKINKILEKTERLI